MTNLLPVRASSPVALGHGPSLVGAAVLVIEDGHTITHGGMPFGAGMVAAQRAAASFLVDPWPRAVGSIAEVFQTYPHIGSVLPAMGYSDEQLGELEATINATECDVVVTGTPIDLGRLLRSRASRRFESGWAGRTDAFNDGARLAAGPIQVKRACARERLRTSSIVRLVARRAPDSNRNRLTSVEQVLNRSSHLGISPSDAASTVELGRSAKTERA